jgi:nucleotide-binding universal stress UspA family protein
LAAALAVARRCAAHIDAVHVRIDPVAVAVASSVEGGVGGPLLESVIAQLEQDSRAREASATPMFAEFCAREGIAAAATPAEAGAGPSGEFHVETGEELLWVAACGRTADLMGVSGSDVTARATLDAVPLETGRPLLIPSAAHPAPAVAGRVAIAWKPTPQAARAVAAATPFLEAAKEIVVISVEEEDAPRDDPGRLLRTLARHGFKADPQRLSPGPRGSAETLLAAATEQAGLLVMGGYGHTRIREWVFGGFTQRVLADAPMPALVAHQRAAGGRSAVTRSQTSRRRRRSSPPSTASPSPIAGAAR